MTSSPSFRRELPTSKVAGGISMGLNSPRPEGTLSFMLSHLTLRMQARMKQYAIRPVSLLSASGHRNMMREIIKFRSLSSSLLRKGTSRSHMLNSKLKQDLKNIAKGKYRLTAHHLFICVSILFFKPFFNCKRAEIRNDSPDFIQ